MSAIKAVVKVLHCTCCGHRRTQAPPMPPACPRCGAPLNTDGTQIRVPEPTLSTSDGSGAWRLLGEGL
jgi:hypothetical protein